ncbi:MAG: GGDEF domain-containing protein [Oscillospiraceae bacterium]|nr:GGDEF domain-containing protein [Oscillospiraceae bacterium]
MTPVIYFDICAAVILVILFCSMVFRKLTEGIASRFLFALLGIAFVSTLSEIYATALDIAGNYGVNSIVPMYILNTSYLLFHNFTIAAYMLYIISLADTWHRIRGRMLLKTLLLFPYPLITILLAVNPFTKIIFYIDENSHYVRGSYIHLLYLCAFYNMCVCTVYLIRHRKLFTRGKFISLMLMLPMEVAAFIIQLFNPELMVEMFSNAIALLIIMNSVHRPEELIDFITGLRKFTAYGTDMKKTFRTDKHVSVIMINISNFLSLYSILNYDGINELLQKIADELNDVNRETKAHADIYYLDRGRFRFVISDEYRDKIDTAAEEINFRLKQSIILNRLELNMIAYICVAKCPEEITDFPMLMHFGNDFHEKLPFSGRVLHISEIMEKNIFSLTSELDNIIDNAIAAKKFQIYYQPIYSTKEKRFVSAEALLRLYDEKYGFISPDIFILAAEKSGAIHKIGEYVLDEVCRFISSDDFKRLNLDYIEINLSVAQCMQSDLADKVLQTIRQYGVTPDKINLEITETAANYSQNIMTANIDKLCSAGISFSLDDYGTGYSNIRSVASLPLTIVKLDKSFVDAESNPRMWVVLQNTIKMIKDMDMHIVVEGVETKQILKRFTDLECEYIQGYYFSKPIPEEEFVKFIEEAAVSVK